jgi:SAM-dependent methyltransferase
MPGFYDSISEGVLEEYVLGAGLGGENPVDLQQFMTFLKKGDKVLEIGCGNGRLGKHLVKDFRYVGIDNHKLYLDSFKRLLEDKGYRNVGDFLRYCSFQDFDEEGFDVILFPWTVIGDFADNEQFGVIKKAKGMLSKGGLILIDNPAKGTTYNAASGYVPNKFYFEDWDERLKSLGFSEVKRIFYETLTGRRREIVVLKD